jgi:hypothetical protein
VQAVIESTRHKPTNKAAPPAAFFATLVTGDEVRLFFFTAIAPLVNAIGNESIAEIFLSNRFFFQGLLRQGAE